MWNSRTVRSRALVASLLLPLKLGLLISFSSLVVGLETALKANANRELPAFNPLLNIRNGESSSDFEQLLEAKLNESASQVVQTQEVLSRKRRYLVFPEGSSYQVVWDEYICVVDHTNYLVLGITVALAWALPSKPPSEAVQDILNKLEDGTLDVSRNDTVSNITYVDNADKITTTQPAIKSFVNLSNIGNAANIYDSYYSNSPIFRTPMHPSYQHASSFYRQPNAANVYYRQPNVPARRKDSYYYSQPMSSRRDPFKKWSQPHSRAQNTRYPYWALPSHLNQRNNYYRPTMRSRHQKVPHIPVAEPKPVAPRHFKIYPVFGKRSIPDAANPHQRHRRSGVTSLQDDQLTKMEGIQIKYHRNSRQNLYEKIERYLDKHGHNGHQCVLRTLCETGQKSNEEEPGSFAGEILRAIFTMPEAQDHEQVAYLDARYDKAHAHKGDCAALYAECKRSIWEAPFVQ